MYTFIHRWVVVHFPTIVTSWSWTLKKRTMILSGKHEPYNVDQYAWLTTLMTIEYPFFDSIGFDLSCSDNKPQILISPHPLAQIHMQNIILAYKLNGISGWGCFKIENDHHATRLYSSILSNIVRACGDAEVHKWCWSQKAKFCSGFWRMVHTASLRLMWM